MENRPEKLLDQVRDAIRVKHYARNTEQAYAYCLTKLSSVVVLIDSIRSAMPHRICVRADAGTVAPRGLCRGSSSASPVDQCRVPRRLWVASHSACRAGN